MRCRFGIGFGYRFGIGFDGMGLGVDSMKKKICGPFGPYIAFPPEICGPYGQCMVFFISDSNQRGKSIEDLGTHFFDRTPKITKWQYLPVPCVQKQKKTENERNMTNANMIRTARGPEQL